MNTKIISYVLSNLFKILIFLFFLPLLVSIYYQEGIRAYLSFIIPMLILLGLIYFLSGDAPEDQSFFSKEAMVIVALSWLLVSFFGALPFIISGDIPNITDAIFESVSGFTTTGATILNDVETLNKSTIFWRSFTHFVGGMGVLVLVLAILPKGNHKALHIMRAEVPGPRVGKLVAKMSYNSRILYIIYLAITGILVVLLMFGGMSLFDACIHAFGTTGTGGFSSKNGSIAFFNSKYIEYILGFGMFISSLNFNLFYLILLGKFKQVFRSEETKFFLTVIVVSILLICINISSRYTSFEKLIRDVFFTVVSIVSSTGYSTVDFGLWPLFSQNILLFLMFMGGCAGSTAGGFKVARTLIFFKKIALEFKKIGHPNKVINLNLEGKAVDKEMSEGVSAYFMLYIFTFILLLFIVSTEASDFLTSFSAVLTTFNNIGPGLGTIGPTYSFSAFSSPIKLALSLSMLLGRLEIIPLLILISPRIYKKID
ncbi:TrkH family potassium uptake protein [Fusobacterium sp.]|uniref:TrkH family potassium uptake protein n=1 Tax=Fusobacterium sp. TaxID=68766 RepID=UPI0025BC7726|nr:TrkH family potassium uptake protein [Fusobacterium sp.]MCI5725031.1 TrkH family potassium uptake protein [Fusobacterium sp.]